MENKYKTHTGLTNIKVQLQCVSFWGGCGGSPVREGGGSSEPGLGGGTWSPSGV